MTMNRSERTIFWLEFAILLGGCVLGFLAVIPYTLTMQAEALAAMELPVSLPVLLLLRLPLLEAGAGVGHARPLLLHVIPALFL